MLDNLYSMIKYLILAGNYKEAKAWADSHKVKPANYLYIFSIKNLVGYRFNENQTELVMTGTYYKRSDLSAIMDNLVYNGFII